MSRIWSEIEIIILPRPRHPSKSIGVHRIPVRCCFDSSRGATEDSRMGIRAFTGWTSGFSQADREVRLSCFDRSVHMVESVSFVESDCTWRPMFVLDSHKVIPLKLHPPALLITIFHIFEKVCWAYFLYISCDEDIGNSYWTFPRTSSTSFDTIISTRNCADTEILIDISSQNWACCVHRVKLFPVAWSHEPSKVTSKSASWHLSCVVFVPVRTLDVQPWPLKQIFEQIFWSATSVVASLPIQFLQTMTFPDRAGLLRTKMRVLIRNRSRDRERQHHLWVFLAFTKGTKSTMNCVPERVSVWRSNGLIWFSEARSAALVKAFRRAKLHITAFENSLVVNCPMSVYRRHTKIW